VRVFLDDDTFKTFLIFPSTTALDIQKQLAEKMRASETKYLYWSLPGGKETGYKKEETPWVQLKQHGESVTFSFRATDPEAPPAAGAGAAQSAAKPAAAANGSKPAASEDDFDALLDQLNFDMGDDAAQVGAAGGEFLSNLPLCAACGMGVKPEDLLKAFGMSWHKEHLACAVCKRDFKLNNVECIEGSDNQAYCRTDFLEKWAPRCGRCTRPIDGQCVNAINKQFHPACFNCNKCHVAFDGKPFMEHEGQPHCEYHYFEAMSLICPTCDKPIIGKCLNARGRRYHPEHFVCFHCRKKLKHGAFFTHNDKEYCKECSTILFG